MNEVERFLRAARLASLALGRLGHRLTHEGELALLGAISEGEQVFDRFEACRPLLTRNNATVVLHQVLLGEAARGATRRSVEYLGFGSASKNGRHGSTCRRDYFPPRKI